MTKLDRRARPSWTTTPMTQLGSEMTTMGSEMTRLVQIIAEYQSCKGCRSPACLLAQSAMGARNVEQTAVSIRTSDKFCYCSDALSWNMRVGPNYAWKGKKSPSKPSLFEFFRCELLRHRQRVQHVLGKRTIRPPRVEVCFHMDETFDSHIDVSITGLVP
eukprot:SAG11_NODE_1697_length_4431_cov_2.166667_3_plen_160_part_00